MKWRIVIFIVGISLIVGSLSGTLISSTSQASATGNNLSDSALQAAGAPACPSNGTCLAMPCPTQNGCGVLETSQTSNLGSNQWVYLNFYGFSGQTNLQVYYCSTENPSISSRLCSFQATERQPIPTASVLTAADGTLSYSFQTEENIQDPTSQAPCQGIGGQVPGVGGQPSNCYNLDGSVNTAFQQFYCDTSGNNNCAIVLVNPSLGPNPGSITPNDQNSLIIPVNFQSTSGSCSTATQLLAEGEPGIDLLLGATDPLTCQAKSSAAVIPFYTALNGLTALDLLEKGQIQIAFTDDAQGSTQQAYIKRDGFLSIPIALSATTVGYRGQMSFQGSSVPQSGIKLSANMVAGILSGSYTYPLGADLGPCSYGAQCPFFSSINDQPGYQLASTFGGYIRSDTAGVTDQMMSWFCKSPAMAMTFPSSIGGSGTESATAEQVLLGTLYPGGVAPSGCLNTDQMPPFVAQNQFFGTYSNPSIQSLKLTQYIASCSSGPCDGFGIFNWAESEYYGLSNAAIQNGSGNFVEPTSSSVSAGVQACTWDANGVCTPNYASTAAPQGYAMTTVISAIVPRNPNMSASDKANLQSALSSILATTTAGSAASSQLPAGMVPLPANIAAVSQDEISKGIANPSYSAPIPAGATTASTSSSYSNNFSQGSFSLGATNAGTSAGATTSSKAKVPSSSPTYGPFVLSASISRMMLPATLVLGLFMAAFGVVMMSSSLVRRRKLRGATQGRESVNAELGEPVTEGGPLS